MTREQVEQKIREILTTETSAIRLSNALFTPDGLFSHLWTDDAERKALVDSELFREANRRFTDLQEQEVEEFAQGVTRRQATNGDTGLPPLETPKSHVA